MLTIAEVLDRTKTITFDCYGTLIDWKVGLRQSFGELFGTDASERLDEIVEAYVKTEAEIEAGPYQPYRQVLIRAAEQLAREFDLCPASEAATALPQMLPNWPPFPDTIEALSRLKKRFRLGVLSNIDQDLFAGTARQLGVGFDFVITAEDVQAYKPAAPHFQRLIETTVGAQSPGHSVLHVAQSLFHDGLPATQLGLAFVWINRYNEKNETAVQPLAEFPNLKSLAEVACAE